jgi:hypothetical protein
LEDDNEDLNEDKDSPEKMRTNYQPLGGDKADEEDDDLMRRLEEECEGVEG